MAAQPAPEAAGPQEPETSMAELLVPLGGQLTLGSTLGYCAGVSLRFFGRMAAVGVGATFCLIQGLAYQGYIQVDWRKVERDYIKLLDVDNDGQITSRDLVHVWSHTSECLAFNLPAGAGFTAGLAYGLGAQLGTSWKAALLAGVGGKMLLPRVALGGLGALGSPAALVGLQTRFGLWSGTAGAGSALPALSARPGYCLSHFLGEPEERCMWSPEALAARGKS
mmetsp:Transcript_113632/g.332044  ORF Transcript_113632/g.332044 Transcript_113632/m.332044 type:complete len:223 (+) Transcript_113632:94-762(+)